jgi:hypothetical protein
VTESVWNCDGGVSFAATTGMSSPSSTLSLSTTNNNEHYASNLLQEANHHSSTRLPGTGSTTSSSTSCKNLLTDVDMSHVPGMNETYCHHCNYHGACCASHF